VTGNTKHCTLAILLPFLDIINQPTNELHIHIMADNRVNVICGAPSTKNHGDYLITYSMQQSPSWEANRFSANQEIPRILWNPKVHYRIHKCRPSVPILSQLYPGDQRD